MSYRDALSRCEGARGQAHRDYMSARRRLGRVTKLRVPELQVIALKQLNRARGRLNRADKALRRTNGIPV